MDRPMRQQLRRGRRHYMQHRRHRRRHGYQGMAEQSIAVIGVLACIIYGLVFKQKT